MTFYCPNLIIFAGDLKKTKILPNEKNLTSSKTTASKFQNMLGNRFKQEKTLWVPMGTGYKPENFLGIHRYRRPTQFQFMPTPDLDFDVKLFLFSRTFFEKIGKAIWTLFSPIFILTNFSKILQKTEMIRPFIVRKSSYILSARNIFYIILENPSSTKKSLLFATKKFIF